MLQVRANSGQHVTLLGGAIPKTSTRQVENNRKPRRSLLQEVHRVPMVPVDEDWLASKQQILSVRMRVTGPLEDDGSPVRASTAISVLSEEVFDTPDDVPDGNSNSILSLAGITYVDRRGICGNGFCEVGERPIEAEAWAESYQFALNLCPTDCPTELRACPAPVGSDVMCGGYGRCLQASGVCDCFIGYGGDDCGDCAPGYLRTPGGQCTPNADTLLAISSSALKVHTGSAGPSPTMIFFISMGAVVISICAVVVGGALTYLRYRLKKAALTQSPAHSKIRTHGCIEHLHDAVDLSHINPMVVQGSAAGNPAGTSLSSTPRAADHHVVSSFAPSKNATESPATPPASPLAAPVEKPPPGCCPATQTHQLSGAKRTRDVQPASHAPQGCFTPCSSPDSQSPPVGDDLNMFSFPSLDIRKDYQPRVLQYNTSPSEIRGSGTANCGTGSAVSRIRSRGSDTGKSSDSEIQDPRPPADEDSPEPSAQLSGGMEAAVPSPSPSPANLE